MSALLSSCVLAQDFAAQYHIQTDLGADRFFRFQTHTGQYRKEILRPDGSQEGTYGWVDPNGVLRLFDYIADGFGYRIVKESLFKVGAPSPGAVVSTRGGELELGFEVYPLDGAPAGNLPAARLVSVKMCVKCEMSIKSKTILQRKNFLFHVFLLHYISR